MSQYKDPNYQKKWREENKEYLQQYEKRRASNMDRVIARREYFLKNHSKRSEFDKLRLKALSRSLKGRYSGFKAGAKRRQLTVDITYEQFCNLRSLPCVYCKGSLPETGAGLDRVDSKKGYTLDNVVPCCGPCNRLKGADHTFEETQVMVTALLNYRLTAVKAG